MSKDRTLHMIKELVKAYLEIKSEIDNAKSEIIKSIMDALDMINFRKIIREVLQEDSGHK